MDVKAFNYSEIKDLVQDGKEKCAESKGDITSFRSQMESILSGRIIDEHFIHDTNQQIEKRTKTESKINQKKEHELELIQEKNSIKKVEETDGKIIITGKVANLETKNNDFQNQLDSFLETGKTPNGIEIETFNSNRFYLILAFIIPLSFYLFMFYTGVIYKALSGFNPESLLSMGGGPIGGTLPTFSDLANAFTTNPLYFLAPFVFFGFGFVLHIFFSNKQKLYALSILVVTFTLDVLIALQIHNQLIAAYELMFSTDQIKQFISVDVLKDINFFIILFLGFIVFIIWSILFDTFLKESEKRDIPNRLKRLIKQNNSRIEELNQKYHDLTAEIETTRTNILNLEAEMRKLPLLYLENSINQFTTGWMTMLNTLVKMADRKNVIDATSAEKDLFIKNHFIITEN